MDNYYLNKSQIIDLTYKYAWAIDSHSWDDFDDIFTEDATFFLSRNLRGPNEIKNYIKLLHNELNAQHLISNHITEIDGDLAICKCQVRAFYTKNNKHNEKYYIFIGYYIDNLIKINNKWKIKNRTLHYIWSGGDQTILNLNSIPIPDVFK